ncbi:MAG: hypothetical protein IPM06_00725 [Rhizobiales bacterium]|nr:hypothetical protein [Hyphomicrobiales bacterium]
MKVIKLALLGTAALAAVSVSARADNLSDLKAQIEALQADVAALQAAPSVPAGYSLLTMSEAPTIVVPGLMIKDKNAVSPTATTIGVLPTADVPASTIIQWSGSVRAAIAYTDHDFDVGAPGGLVDYNELHLKARGRLSVTGTTDTAVGEVGASVSFAGDFNNKMAGGTGFTSNSASVFMDYAWGWWKMTPELTFAGGYNSSLATIGYGMAKVTDTYINDGDVEVQGGDMTQLQLSYNSGPVGVAIALEHTDEGGNTPVGVSGGPLGVAAEVTYSGDMFNAEIAGFVRDADPAISPVVAASKVTQSQIGLGLGAKLSDMFDISVAGSIGNNIWFSDNVGWTYIGDGWELSGAVVASLSDSISAELGAGISSYDADWNGTTNAASTDEVDTTAIAGGIYWSPVSQLKIGAQASWVEIDSSVLTRDETEMHAAFVTWWNF